MVKVIKVINVVEMNQSARIKLPNKLLRACGRINDCFHKESNLGPFMASLGVPMGFMASLGAF
jgi:hypothetical protein